MIDWAAMDIGNHGVVTAHQAQLAYCYRIVGKYCEETGRTAEGNKFLEADEALLAYIDRFMWDKDRRMYLDGWSPEKGNSSTVSIQTHIMLYLYDGIMGEDKKELVKQYLLNPPAEFLKVGVAVYAVLSLSGIWEGRKKRPYFSGYQKALGRNAEVRFYHLLGGFSGIL